MTAAEAGERPGRPACRIAEKDGCTFSVAACCVHCGNRPDDPVGLATKWLMSTNTSERRTYTQLPFNG